MEHWIETANQSEIAEATKTDFIRLRARTGARSFGHERNCLVEEPWQVSFSRRRIGRVPPRVRPPLLFSFPFFSSLLVCGGRLDDDRVFLLLTSLLSVFKCAYIFNQSAGVLLLVIPIGSAQNRHYFCIGLMIFGWLLGHK